MTAPSEEMTSPAGAATRVPRRPFGSRVGNEKLAASVPIVGLGCSSFSTFFWTPEELSAMKTSRPTDFTAESLSKDHPRVQEWIRTIRYAVEQVGINLLDTAPWYGHGSSEVVIGLAMQDGLSNRRHDFILNTKVGRYDADPSCQFDFSKDTTLKSIQRSLQRMHCDYIDVLQLHDPEFAPSLDMLFEETIPALQEARTKGWCRAVGLTGYPLEVQYQILQRSLSELGHHASRRLWDQTLTYGHFNLHDTTLTQQPIPDHASFTAYLQHHSIGLLAAAPLSMGLLTSGPTPEWHPASSALQEACLQAANICDDHEVNLAELATVFALSDPTIACTIIGCRNVEEVQRAAKVAQRFATTFPTTTTTLQQDKILAQVLTAPEQRALQTLRDPSNGPFASVWKNGGYQWDGVAEAHAFWKSLSPNSEHTDVQHWQMKSFSSTTK